MTGRKAEDGDIGAAMAVVLALSHEWQLRKVESWHFEEGQYNTKRVSVDCVPQEFSGLRVGEDHSASVLVPLTFMTKGVLRNLDVRDASGQSLPVLGRSQYADVMVEALLYELREAVVQPAEPELRRALSAILDADPAPATAAFRALMSQGAFEGTHCLDPSMVSTYARSLLDNLTRLFVLIVLLPAAQAGSRQVLKFSHQSQYELSSRWQTRWRRGAGIVPYEFEIVLGHPAGAASHHLEIEIPSAFDCELLTLPDVARDRNTADFFPSGVAHAAASYKDDPTAGAKLQLTVPLRGLRSHAAFISFVTGILLLLGVVLPGAQQALLEASDGAAALLLALPAVLVAVLASRRETAIVTEALRPLREVVIGCALLLFACAGSIVGFLHDPWRHALWIFGSCGTLGMSAFLVWHEVSDVVSGRKHAKPGQGQKESP